MLQTSVEIVKPGGTGRPALVISARPDPLPPSRSVMCRLPSALPLPKKNTCGRGLELGVRDLGLALLARFAIYVISVSLLDRRDAELQPCERSAQALRDFALRPLC